jgi:hypothetical protein
VCGCGGGGGGGGGGGSGSSAAAGPAWCMCEMESDLRGSGLGTLVVGERGYEGSGGVPLAPTPDGHPDRALGHYFGGNTGTTWSPLRPDRCERCGP